jgi:hypothetical protein
MKVQNELDKEGQNYANTYANCIQLYFNAAISDTFNSQRCPLGQSAAEYIYTVPANKYSSTTS